MGHRRGERPFGRAGDHARRGTPAPAPAARASPRRRGAPGIRQQPEAGGADRPRRPAGSGHAQEGRRTTTGNRNQARALPERIYYPYLERPALIIYPLGSGGPGDNPSAEEQHNVTIGQDGYLVALKVAIPGDPTKVHDAEGDVTYVINTVAQKNWLSEFSGADDEDLDD